MQKNAWNSCIPVGRLYTHTHTNRFQNNSHAINIRIINIHIYSRLLCILFSVSRLLHFLNVNDRHSGIYSISATNAICHQRHTIQNKYSLHVHASFTLFQFCDGVCFPETSPPLNSRQQWIAFDLHHMLLTLFILNRYIYC